MSKKTIRLCIIDASRDIERFDAELLLAFVLKKPRIWLLAHADEGIGISQQNRFQSLVLRRKRSEPVAYLIGETSFYAKPFFTDKRALIPRPETEDLVTRALGYVHEQPEEWAVWDVGTGSGAIAVALASQEPMIQVIASDVSLEALQLARKNARRHQVKIGFIHASLCDQGVKKRLEKQKRTHLLIVANLPYLPTSDKKKMMPDVKNYEPSRALFAPAEGMGLIVTLLKQLADWRREQPLIALFECDPPQTKTLLKKAKGLFPKAKCQILKDMYRRPRFLEIISGPIGQT